VRENFSITLQAKARHSKVGGRYLFLVDCLKFISLESLFFIHADCDFACLGTVFSSHLTMSDSDEDTAAPILQPMCTMIDVLARCTSVTVKLQISGAIGKILTSWGECDDEDDYGDEDYVGITISDAILEIHSVATKLCHVINGACTFPPRSSGKVVSEEQIQKRTALVYKLVWIITQCVKHGSREQRSIALAHFGKCGAIQSLSKVLLQDEYSSISYEVMGLLVLFSHEPSNLQEFRKVGWLEFVFEHVMMIL
jgi:hypothetical protein